MARNVLIMLVVLGSLSCSPSKSQTMKSKSPVTLNHIAVYVTNLQKSADFYTNIIGLDTIPEPFHDGRHVWFTIGPNSHLHIISGAAAITAHDKNSHLCFSVPSVENFTSTLTKNNIEFENWAGDKNKVTARVDGIKQIYFRDPDGFWIEINDDHQ